LLAGSAVKRCGEVLSARFSKRWLAAAPVLIFAIGYGMALYAQRADFFQLSPAEVIRHQYGGNPFPEAVQIGRYIREHAEPDAKIAVLGSEPEIFFYAERESATGYIYTYGLMEEQRYAAQMQQEMIGEIEHAKPEYLVKVMVPASWLRKTNSDTTILLWADKYISDSYRVVGIVDVGTATTYHWDDAAESYTPRSPYSVYVYKRKI
jgi:hypothetical protein